MGDIENMKDNILSLWDRASKEKEIKMFIGFLGWEFIDQEFIERIRDCDDYEQLKSFFDKFKVDKE